MTSGAAVCPPVRASWNASKAHWSRGAFKFSPSADRKNPTEKLLGAFGPGFESSAHFH
jgi:hypothetical protein